MEEDQEATSDVNHYKNIDLSTILESCRICMAQNGNMSPIFDGENIIKEILYCTGVCLKEEDGLPSKICAQCLKDLSVAYKFKSSCVLADKTFHKIVVRLDIKTEVMISDVEYEEDFGDTIKEQAELESAVIQNGSTKSKIQKEKKEKSKLASKPLKRSRKAAAPRRLKKFKFRKLHCETCDIKFDSKQQCDEHKRQTHKDSESWVCEICGKMFAYRASHYTHVKSHLPPQFDCDLCEYKTCHKYDLVKHIRIHTGIKQYQCEYCTASYYTAGNLTGHIRGHHLKLRPFSCAMCRKSFFDRTKLNRHMDTHNDVKRYECELCHSRFTRRCYWKKHLLRQHDIVIPPQRPGRQKTNAVVGEDLIKNVDIIPAQKT